jgi:hypothetical protein
MPKNNFFNRDVMFADANGNFLPFDDSTEFFNKWNEYSITIETEKGPITIKWNDVQSLAANWFMQTGSWMKNPNLQTFFDFFPMWVNYNWWQNSQRNVYNLPDHSKIIDIGAGNSVIDLLLHKYIPGSELYLVDRNSFVSTKKTVEHPTRENPCWLHSWSTVEDAIDASNIDRSKFHFLDVDDEWNMEVDMITSYMAWCMHFPKQIYWQRVLQSLKIGGRLLVDVNIGWEKELIEEISDELHCRHTVISSIPIKKIFNADIPTDQPIRDQLEIAAYRCSWVRNR